tara:strand:- start:71 stop:748 length:678 start_codon:yes stop_codon:yes gene_type:complete
MLKKFFVFITVLALLSSCNEKFDHLKFEKQVAYEVFPQLMDSLHRDNRIPIPAPSYKTDSLGNRLEYDTIESQRGWKEFDRLKLEYYQDSVKLVTAISDSTFLLEGGEKSQLLKFYNLNNSDIDTINTNEKYKIDLDKLNADNKIKFIYRSDLPEGREIWRTDYKFYLNSVLSISRIQFDINKKFGVMSIGYSIGILNGIGCRVFIRKNNEGDWVIDKIQTTTIS